ncbi:MGMT family protein [bacterium]|nr:MAG: MGMT family protein [bacterium]
MPGYFTVRFPLGLVVVHYNEPGSLMGISFDLDGRTPESRSSSALAGDLDSYLKGNPEPLDHYLDLSFASPFSRQVWTVTRQIPFGSVMSYGELAAKVDRIGGARAVGQAMGSNRFPLLIPCHRVVARGGALGGFGSGQRLKRWLLELEGVSL